MATNYIYLIHPRELIITGKHIYKIGKTKQENFKRINQYPFGSVLLLQTACIDCANMEKEIINKFKTSFIHKNKLGNEYFEGNVVEMINIINSIIKSEINNPINNNSLSNYMIDYNDRYNIIINTNNNIKNNKNNNKNNKNINEFIDNNNQEINNEESDNEEINNEEINNEEINNQEINNQEINNEEINNQEINNENKIIELENTEDVNEFSKNDNNDMSDKPYYYKCKRCFYSSIKICNMKTHLLRINKCEPVEDTYEYDEDELYKLSLVKHVNNNYKPINSNNKSSINNEHNEDNNDKKFKCEVCNMLFSTNGNLKRHTLKSCKSII